MSENCSHDCSSCNASCSQRTQQSTVKEQNKFSNVKKVIGIVSGKGGVGKSLVTSLIAQKCAKAGLKVGILDADITGPSIPKSFGVHTKAMQDEKGIIPGESRLGIKMMSINLLLEDENAPVVWRGPIISGVIEQFWSDVNWGELDYLFVDMPPGTGDAALTVFKSLPINGIVVVTTPQELVKMIVNKALKMAEIMNVPVLGIIENMSYFVCSECGAKHSIFGESSVDEAAKENGVPVLAKLGIDPEINRLVDRGMVENVNADELNDFVSALL